MKSGTDLSGEMPNTFGLVVLTIALAAICIGIGYLWILGLEVIWQALRKIL